MRRLEPWLAPALFAAARLAFAPRTHNTHAIMYPVVAELGGRNSLELFHPLYVPLLRLLNVLRHGCGFSGPSIHLYQALSLAGAMVQLRLIYALAARLTKGRKTALAAALLATASVNLWCWSLQTMPYTLATSAALGCLLVLVDSTYPPTRPGPSSWITLGALTGLAMGFDTASLVLIPICLVARKAGKTKAVYLGAFALTLLAAYLPFLALGRSIPPSPSALLKGLPFDIVSLMQSHSLGAQMKDWLASTAPSEAPWLLLAALFAAGAAFAKGGKLALAWFLGISAFFFIADPHNRFVYAGALLAPVVLAAMAEKRGFPLAACAAAWLLLLGKNLASPPDYLPRSNASLDEAAFVSSSLSPDDLLVAVSQPDLLFSYAYAKHSAVVWPGDSPGLPLADVRARAERAARDGRVVWLASDAMFRDSDVPAGVMEKRVQRLAASFAPALEVAREGVVSPNDQWYYPLRLASKKR